MTGKRTRYSADCKARVALEALRGELTTAQETAKATEAEVEKLHAKIGQVVVERDFSARASGR